MQTSRKICHKIVQKCRCCWEFIQPRTKLEHVAHISWNAETESWMNAKHFCKKNYRQFKEVCCCCFPRTCAAFTFSFRNFQDTFMEMFNVASISLFSLATLCFKNLEQICSLITEAKERKKIVFVFQEISDIWRSGALLTRVKFFERGNNKSEIFFFCFLQSFAAKKI